MVRITAVGLTVRNVWLAVAIVAAAPVPAQAQFGMLKKLKNAATKPDSAAQVKDSLDQIAAGVLPESVKVNKGSKLARGLSAANSASNKLEAATGISAKDAALAATGVGAAGLVAKKLANGQSGIGSQVASTMKANAQQKVMSAAMGGTGNGAGMAGRIPGMPDLASMQAMQKAAAGMAPKMGQQMNAAAMLGGGMAGITSADAQAMVAFQQEMMQVAMAASAGDEGAQARLEKWQTLTLKYEGDVQKLSMLAASGDVSAVKKMHDLQFRMIRDWASTGSLKEKVKKRKP
jgi:hypothetical protein